MKKLKVLIMSLAVITAIASAFAMRPALVCDNQFQYSWDGSVYRLAGVYGEDFDCDFNPAITCTYYRPNPMTHPNSYSACKLGWFIELGSRTSKPKKKNNLP